MSRDQLRRVGVASLLLLACLGLAQVAQAQRGPRVRPRVDPLCHQIRLAAEEGLGFREGPSILCDHATAPHGLRTADGRILIVYQNAYYEALWIAESRDEGATFRYRPVSISGELGAVADGCLVDRGTEGLWLYATERFAVEGGEATRIRLARSTDGIAFSLDPTPCCQGAAISAPDVYRLPDASWAMHLSEGPRVWQALSRDGVTFEWDGALPITADGGTTQTVEHEPGEYRMYFAGASGIRTYGSRDGRTWSASSTATLTSPAVGSPCPVRTAAGWRLYYRYGLEMPALPQGSTGLQGPAAHRIISARSADLRAWEYEPGVRLPMASVQAPLALPDGRVLLYYVDAAHARYGGGETANVAVSEDGLSFQALGLTIDGSPFAKALDPAPLLLPDGRIRLYFYGCAGDPGAVGDHVIASAISADGVRFQYEGECLRKPELVDPDVWFDGRTYRMLVFGGKRTLQATSGDGLAFEQSGSFPFLGWGATRPVELAPGQWSLFAFEQLGSQSGGNSVKRFVSSDGALWREQAGVLLRAPEGWQVTDPHVVPCEGGYRMYLKAEVRGSR